MQKFGTWEWKWQKHGKHRLSIFIRIVQNLNVAIKNWSWKHRKLKSLSNIDALMRRFFRLIDIEVDHKRVMETLFSQLRGIRSVRDASKPTWTTKAKVVPIKPRKNYRLCALNLQIATLLYSEFLNCCFSAAKAVMERSRCSVNCDTVNSACSFLIRWSHCALIMTASARPVKD